jgi:hypothetical protein
MGIASKQVTPNIRKFVEVSKGYAHEEYIGASPGTGRLGTEHGGSQASGMRPFQDQKLVQI